MRTILLAATLALSLSPSLAVAQAVPVNGEVTKVDTALGKITLRHGPIKNLDMEAMTMVFRAGDADMLKAVKPGDRVVFEAERVNGQITITKLRKAP